MGQATGSGQEETLRNVCCNENKREAKAELAYLNKLNDTRVPPINITPAVKKSARARAPMISILYGKKNEKVLKKHLEHVSFLRDDHVHKIIADELQGRVKIARDYFFSLLLISMFLCSKQTVSIAFL